MGRLAVHDVLIQQVVGAPDRITRERADRLPFGALELDLDANVLFFNAHEESVSGHSRADVVGKNFFAFAPCANVKKFRFHFAACARDHSLNERFEFMFKFADHERLVDIWMVYSEITGTVWVLVTPRTEGR
jgi:photoactive yellow protein